MKRPRLLVANRGEVAVRIFRACRDLGLETVAVYSDADRASPHVAMADYAARLGPAPARESYLSVPALLAAANKTGATLVHPGYGFLAENAGFARACAGAGLTFVGPSPEAIAAMGSKTGSRELMRKAGVPVVPGTTRAASGATELAEFAARVGYPILLKASAGGGGKGMRRVDSAVELEGALQRVSSEAQASFGDGAIYAEKLVERPRHVEVQVVGDSRGGLVAVGERECSVQRRHQKVVEECPSPAVDPALRVRLLEAALSAARAVGYTSCGTVEFLLAPDGSFYFLEMNTRLQVEHPVTEEVWGVDLAAAMIRIALGEPLPFSARDLSPRGHALECRVYAEDPRRGFAPSPGRIESLRLPQGPGVRNDVRRRGRLGRADRLRPDARQAHRARPGPRFRRFAPVARALGVRGRRRRNDAAALSGAHGRPGLPGRELRRPVARSTPGRRALPRRRSALRGSLARGGRDRGGGRHVAGVGTRSRVRLEVGGAPRGAEGLSGACVDCAWSIAASPGRKS